VSAALWIAARELRARWSRVALAAALVAALAASATAMEVLGRAREEAIAARIDDMGPALTVVPGGVNSGELARYELGGRVLPDGVVGRIEAVLGTDLRTTECRLVLTRNVSGVAVPVVGREERRPDSYAENGAFVGAELARRLGDERLVSIDGTALRVRGVLPSTGGIEDLSLTVPLARAQELEGSPGAVNEVRVYLRAGVSAQHAERRLVAASIGAAIVRHDRGEVAGREIQDSLARHRDLAYGVMALVAAVCLLIVSHLDAAERRLEISTLVAIGAPGSLVLCASVGRFVFFAIVGAGVGVGAGFVLAAVHDPAVAGALVRHWSVGVATLVTAAGVATAAAAPTGFASAVRDPVPALQES
jgi:hypothetical protein